jgi:serine/threonine protein kinase
MDPGEENLDSRIDELLRRVAHVSAAQVHAAETVEMPHGAQAARQHAPARGVPEPGSVVDGRYRVNGTLGEGAMGVVLSAHNLRTGREVALKYMLGDEQVPYLQRCARVERFVREAQAVGRVRDPHVVDIYDVGGDLDAPYLVMERLHGQSLRERMRAGPLDEAAVVGLAIEAARGVSAAHRQGVIHRDLKPDNLFLAREEDGVTRVKVLDFGVSRILDNTAVLATITRSGAIVGTPAYMPLEQLRGEHEVDARVDVYALGAIMYEALSGKLPFEGRTLHDLVLLMASDMPTPLASVAPHVSPWLCSVVMKCLSRTPSHRFDDMTALISALEAREEVPVPSLAPAKPLEAQVAKRKVPVWLVLALFLLGTTMWLLFAYVSSAPHAQPQPSATVSTPKAKPNLTVEAKPSQAVEVPTLEHPPSGPDNALIAPLKASDAPAETLETEAPAKRAHPPRPRPNPAERARDLRPEDF